jgi:hypothetical protein
MDDVEKVARAICIANEQRIGSRLGPDHVMTCGPKEFIGQPLWRQYQLLAQAAIEAYAQSEALKEAATTLWVALEMLDFRGRPATETMMRKTLRRLEATIAEIDPEWSKPPPLTVVK